MKSGVLFSLAVALLLGLIAVAGAAFTVDQTEQALVLRFGEPAAGRGLITTPGHHFKPQLLENIVFFDNRLIVVERPNLAVLAAIQQRPAVYSVIRVTLGHGCWS